MPAFFIGTVKVADDAWVPGYAADPDDKPHLDALVAGSDSGVVLIDDTDLAGAIPYLPKAG